jgi:hypothetical protein
MAVDRITRIPGTVIHKSVIDANDPRVCTGQSGRGRLTRRHDPITAPTMTSRPLAGDVVDNSPAMIRHRSSPVARPRPGEERRGPASLRVRRESFMKKVAEYRKALVSGIGATSAVAVSAMDSFGPYLSASVTHWAAAGLAMATAVGTFLTKNAAPEAPAESAPDTADEPAASVTTRNMGWAIAVLTVALGGAMFAGRNRGRRLQPIVPFAVLLPPCGSSAGRPRSG